YDRSDWPAEHSTLAAWSGMLGIDGTITSKVASWTPSAAAYPIHRTIRPGFFCSANVNRTADTMYTIVPIEATISPFMRPSRTAAANCACVGEGPIEKTAVNPATKAPPTAITTPTTKTTTDRITFRL